MTLAVHAAPGDFVTPGTGGAGVYPLEGSEGSTGVRGSPPPHLGGRLSTLAGGVLATLTPWAGELAHLRELAPFFLGPATGSATSIRLLPELEIPTTWRAAGTSIAQLRAALGLNVSETARALGVERATVYAWVAGRSEPQRLNWARLSRLEVVAESWRRRSPWQLGDLVRRPGPNGRSVADLLAQEPIPSRDIEDRLDQAALQLAESRMRPERRVRGIRDWASTHGLPAPALASAESEISSLTRPSLGPEDE